MLRIISYAFLIVMTINLMGCSWFGKNNFVNKRETEYMRADEVAPIQLPPGVSSDALGNDYVVPPAMRIVQPINLIPPGSLADGIARGVIPKSALKQKLEPATTPTVADEEGVANPIMLTLDQSKAQMWNKIGASLKRYNYVVVNQNEFTGIYYILDMTAFGSKVDMSTPIYQLHVQNVNNVAQVYVTDNNGKNIPPETAQAILSDLHDALSGKAPSPVMKFLKELF